MDYLISAQRVVGEIAMGESSSQERSKRASICQSIRTAAGTIGIAIQRATSPAR